MTQPLTPGMRESTPAAAGPVRSDTPDTRGDGRKSSSGGEGEGEGEDASRVGIRTHLPDQNETSPYRAGQDGKTGD